MAHLVVSKPYEWKVLALSSPDIHQHIRVGTDTPTHNEHQTLCPPHYGFIMTLS